MIQMIPKRQETSSSTNPINPIQNSPAFFMSLPSGSPAFPPKKIPSIP
jgi:hypothetical protein